MQKRRLALFARIKKLVAMIIIGEMVDYMKDERLSSTAFYSCMDATEQRQCLPFLTRVPLVLGKYNEFFVYLKYKHQFIHPDIRNEEIFGPHCHFCMIFLSLGKYSSHATLYDQVT